MVFKTYILLIIKVVEQVKSHIISKYEKFIIVIFIKIALQIVKIHGNSLIFNLLIARTISNVSETPFLTNKTELFYLFI
jgi:hypothetical protein